MIIVLNRRRSDEGIYVGRGTPLGNPFHIGEDGDREEVVAKYAGWLKRQPDGSPAIRMLVDLARYHKDNGVLYLSCWCKPLACHSDIIAEAVKLIEPHVEQSE